MSDKAALEMLQAALCLEVDTIKQLLLQMALRRLQTSLANTRLPTSLTAALPPAPAVQFTTTSATAQVGSAETQVLTSLLSTELPIVATSGDAYVPSDDAPTMPRQVQSEHSAAAPVAVPQVMHDLASRLTERCRLEDVRDGARVNIFSSKAAGKLFLDPLFYAIGKIKPIPGGSVTTQKAFNLLAACETITVCLNALRFLLLRLGALPVTYAAEIAAWDKAHGRAEEGIAGLARLLALAVELASTALVAAKTPDADMLGLWHVKLVIEHILEFTG